MWSFEYLGAPLSLAFLCAGSQSWCLTNAAEPLQLCFSPLRSPAMDFKFPPCRLLLPVFCFPAGLASVGDHPGWKWEWASSDCLPPEVRRNDCIKVPKSKIAVRCGEAVSRYCLGIPYVCTSGTLWKCHVKRWSPAYEICLRAFSELFDSSVSSKNKKTKPNSDVKFLLYL